MIPHYYKELHKTSTTEKPKTYRVMGLRRGKTATPGVLIPLDMQGLDLLKAQIRTTGYLLLEQGDLGVTEQEKEAVRAVLEWCYGGYHPGTEEAKVTHLRLPFLLVYEVLLKLDVIAKAWQQNAGGVVWHGTFFTHQGIAYPKTTTPELGLKEDAAVHSYTVCLLGSCLSTIYREALATPNCN